METCRGKRVVETHVVEGCRGCRVSWNGVVENMGVVEWCRGLHGYELVSSVVSSCRGEHRGHMGTNQVSWTTSWIAHVVEGCRGMYRGSHGYKFESSVVGACRGRCRGSHGYKLESSEYKPGVVDNIVDSRCRGWVSWEVSWITWVQV